ncbi:MAG: hypothetical protein ACKO2G_07135 [Verrucomicrobiales bacterium]
MFTTKIIRFFHKNTRFLPGPVSDAKRPEILHFEPFTWPNAIPEDCPFAGTEAFTDIRFLGIKSGFRYGDTWYPTWAENDTLYSPWTDGKTKRLDGDWKIITYMKEFGTQAYFVNFPSRFIGADGLTMWLLYSANFSLDPEGKPHPVNPPGGHYGITLQKVQVLRK